MHLHLAETGTDVTEAEGWPRQAHPTATAFSQLWSGRLSQDPALRLPDPAELNGTRGCLLEVLEKRPCHAGPLPHTWHPRPGSAHCQGLASRASGRWWVRAGPCIKEEWEQGGPSGAEGRMGRRVGDPGKDLAPWEDEPSRQPWATCDPTGRL